MGVSMFRSSLSTSVSALLCTFGLLAATTLHADADTGARAARKAARSRTVAANIAAFKKVCATVNTVSSNEFLYKSDISHHISSGDARAQGPTLVCNRVCPQKFPAGLYYSNGALAAKLGYYGRWNVSGQPRAYCATGGAAPCSNTTLARTARARGNDGFLYLQTSAASQGAKTVCYRVKALGRTGNPQ
jgi:hypothetical protein